MPPAPSSDLGAQPEQIRQKAALLGASSTSEQTRIATKVLLHEVADVPLEEITDDAALEGLGIDSLMASELLSAIRDRFDIEISASCYEELLDFKALYRHIDSKIDNYSSAAASCYGSETDCGNTETPLTSPGDSEEEYLSHDEVAIDISHRNLVDKLSELFAEHLGASDRIASDMPLHSIGIDSLMGIELAADIEKVFSKKLDLAALEPDCTFGELCDMVTPRKQHPERAKIIAKENTFPEESTPARFAAEARIVESDKCGDKIPTMETVQFAEVDGVPLHADIYYPAQEDAPGRQRPIGRFHNTRLWL
jgi:acyl carrier protein